MVEESEPVISRVINGRDRLKPDDKKNWAKALSCKVTDIFDE